MGDLPWLSTSRRSAPIPNGMHSVRPRDETNADATVGSRNGPGLVLRPDFPTSPRCPQSRRVMDSDTPCSPAHHLPWRTFQEKHPALLATEPGGPSRFRSVYIWLLGQPELHSRLRICTFPARSPPPSHSSCLVTAFFLVLDGNPLALSRLACLPRSHPLHSVIRQQMQGVTPKEVVRAAVAFAVPSLIQLLYALRGPIRSLLYTTTKSEAAWRPDWGQLSWWLFWFCAGIAVAVPFGFARARGLPYAPALFDVWKGVSLLAAEALIAVVVYPAYHNFLKAAWSTTEALILRYFWIPVVVHQTLQFSLGIWSRVKHGSQFIWSTPVSLYLTVLVGAIWYLVKSNPKQNKAASRANLLLSFGILITANLTALMVTIVGASHDWKEQHLVQCFLCTGLVLEYLLVQLLRAKLRKKRQGSPLTSQDPSATAGDSR
ncbi:hypothetical protein N658DRAFT_263357 [Parathielavia hyrcaniae]|uniref:Uncharacterized protein n=1 Tax=Parathielavia hyrcaniae TaxID=113614 RepID=A0AAN6SYR7_9PEZI|nr:hypothetical protein N658DRAFT_263357 [Parathielavia hyrcaniae]